MRVPDFNMLFQAAVRIIPFAEIMTALAPITEGQTTAYRGEPSVALVNDRITLTADGDTYVIDGALRAAELLVKVMLNRPGAALDPRLEPFREAAYQLRQARSYTLLYEYQKAELARLAEQPALLSQAWANLNSAVVVNGESAQTREWRVLLDFPIADIEGVVLTHSDHAHELRKFSPARGLISEDERFAICERVRVASKVPDA